MQQRGLPFEYVEALRLRKDDVYVKPPVLMDNNPRGLVPVLVDRTKGSGDAGSGGP